MAFKSLTYLTNRARREAWLHLDKAREIASRRDAGRAYDFEVPAIAHNVLCARLAMHQHLALRRAVEFGKAASSNG